MLTTFLAIIVGLAASLCIYGKQFWEKRISALILTVAVMLVAVVTSGFVMRPQLSLTSKIHQSYELNPMWLSTKNFYMFHEVVRIESGDSVEYCYESDTTITNMRIDSAFDINDYDAENLIVRGIIRDTIKNDSGYFVKETYKDEMKVYGVLYQNGEDYRIGVVRNEPGDTDIDTDYWTMGEDLYIVPIEDGDTSKPRIEFYQTDYEKYNKWTVSEMLVYYGGSYKVIYLPKKDYEMLPESFKQDHFFKGKDFMLNQEIEKL